MSREMTGYQQSVRKALDYAGHDKKVHGVLALLINVPRELETAIDMALGGALQNIVTDDEETAKRLIDYLRTNRLGRATFLPISSVRSRVLNPQERTLLRMQGCRGVASELISYDERYRGIVESLLGRTVIADDLDHGIPIMRAGRHAFRLVTVSGDVMHSGGSMTGGTTQGHTVSLLGREREIKDLRDQIAAKRTQLEKLNQRLKDDNDRYQSLRQAQDQSLSKLRQTELELTRINERVSADRQDEDQLRQRIEQTAQARDQLLSSIAEIEADIEAISRKQDAEGFDSKAMEAKTEELQKAMLKNREAADKQRAAVTGTQMALSRLESRIDSIRRELDQKTRQQIRNEALIAQHIEQTKELTVSIAELTNEIAQAETLTAELKKRHESTLLEVNKLEQRRSEETARQRELVKNLEDAHKAMDQDSQKLHRTELSLNRSQNELSQMTDHMISAYDLTYAGAMEYKSNEPFEIAPADQEVSDLRTRIREMGSVNLTAIETYETESQRYKELTGQRDDLLKARDDLESLIKRLLKQMEGIFTAEFKKLGEYFSETFTRLFGGGQAELRLADESDPLNCGIDIIAQPPGKKLQLLSLLSGGERALTAIAILFAMLKLKPTPFCILDEIEAALDDSNISNFADYLNEYAKTTQFVVVTHRKGTMENCDSLYGVAMQERGVSSMVSVNLQDYPN